MTLLSRRKSAALLIVVMAAILAVLGRLQYRSIQQVSDARARDMEEALQSSLFDFRHALERELDGLCLELQSSGEGSFVVRPKEVAHRLGQWRDTAVHPALVDDVFLWDGNSETEPVLVSPTGFYKPSPWPPSLAGLPEQLKNLFPEASLAPALTRSHGAPAGKVLQFGQGSQFGWMVDQERLVLLHPTLAAAEAGPPRTVWLIVSLNREFLIQLLIPELARNQFGHGENYQVAVVIDGAGTGTTVLYSSQPGFGSDPGSVPDARLNLFGPPSLVRGTFFSHGPGVVFPASESADGAPPLFIDPLVQSPRGPALEVMAQHREGSLEAAVAALRQRYFLLNFGVLGILAITLIVVVVASQRAHLLGQMQMDFVAGISHELRTPLTAIILAARNLEDGVVHENGLARYGAAIKGQATQLTGLVDEILLFSETHSGRHIYKLEAVDVVLGIHSTLENMAPLIESSGFTLEERINPDLPLVCADAAAFSQCLQNLVSNSLKYGGGNQWIGVQAFTSSNGKGKEICVSVEDHGIGIKSSELKQIFDPFYRSPGVASQTHGNGLGLPLTKTMVEAMGGRLTVSSEPGKGSTFTIHLRPA